MTRDSSMITAEEAFRAKSKAEGQLTAALTKTRQIKRKVNAHGLIDQEPETVRKEEDAHSSASTKANVMVPPRPPIQTAHQEEISQVRVLDIPQFDATRQFPGLAKQKIVKKERHMKAIDDFTYLLDVVAEGIEQDVLNLSRTMREDLEKVDESLKHSYDLLQSPSFLVPKSESDLKDMLEELKRTIIKRLRIVDAFGEDLDGLEKKRADKVGSELKALVDRLIAIAHQLPDEIEKIVETNIFDLNSVLTTNRKAHAALLGMLRKTHVEIDIETLQRWEDGRVYWRQQRHDKALGMFDEDITSNRFKRPDDRTNYMLSVQEDQKQRQQQRHAQLQILGGLTSDGISSTTVQNVISEASHIADIEMDAVTAVFGRLTELRADLKKTAAERVEELRKELHVYGALHAEPPLHAIADIMKDALADEALADLWRLGGGLKVDFQTMSTDMYSVNLAYDPFVISIRDRLTQVCSGLTMRKVLEERGKLMQLDKVRNFVGKLRGVSKYEVPAVLESLVPELEDFMGYEQMSSDFHACVQECLREMAADLERVRLTPMIPDTSATAGTAKGKSSARTATSTSKGKTRGPPDVPNFIDPNLVKSWNRKLGILYFGCDLPIPVQEAALTGLEYTNQQLECNAKVDKVVLESSETELDVMDKKYKRLNEDIAEFMEAQGNFMAICMTNMSTFFLNIAKMVEAHRKAQKTLDEASADALYDLSEDMRIQKEDAEVEFEKSCDVLRAATTHEELHANFENVLEILDSIQESYRVYHGKACFQADKYPLSLVNEYRDYLVGMSAKFNMTPKEDHALLVCYEDIFDETIRLNRKFFDDDLAAGGVPPRPSDIARKEEEEAEAERAAAAAAAAAAAGSRPATAPQSASPSRPISQGGSLVGSVEPMLDEDEPVYESPLVVAAIKAAQAAKKKKTKKEIEKEKSLEKMTVVPPPSSLSGAFKIMISLDETVAKLREEADDEPETAESEETKGGEEEPAAAAPTSHSSMAHPECSWIRKDATLLPVSEEVELAMDEYELRDYEKCLAKRFLKLSEEQLAELSEEDAARYNRTQVVVTRAQERLAIEENPLHIRENVPLNLDEEPWVLKFEIDISTMTNLLVGIRDSLVTSVEIEADRRVKRSDEMKKDYKDEFTEELEDRLRTHWPRRGRVETGIKQPREAELLGHEEKTWRLIQNIQEKMIYVQKRFEINITTGKERCDVYKTEVADLETFITTEKFRNLAKLQGVEVKARGLYISFQAASAKRVADIKKILDEVGPIIAYAMDFRKICPPQEPGVEGGYSPAEILEIETLMIGQCDDCRAIVLEWQDELSSLAQLQDETSLVQGQFTKKYEKVAQDLAMSEGLGQKYGAPRRRAQERIRTEVSRDESSAGKIDEMLAKLEFEVSEAVRMEEHPETMIPEVDEDAVPDPVADNGFKQMDQSKSIWTLMGALRSACKARVDYLKVEEIAVPVPDLPWTPARITKVSELPDEAVDDMGEDEEMAFQNKSTTIDEVMVDVDAACRKETQELYNSEGLGEMLGDGGVPDALQAWLAESKDKILGSGGHREKAWKRLWGQVTRFEKLVGRKIGTADEEEETKEVEEKGVAALGIPGVCIRLNTDANLRYLKYLREEEEAKFMKLVKIWEKGREKHERLLRPRMGSPDAVDELRDLDQKEKERSADLTTNVKAFRAELVTKLSDHSQMFVEDVSLSSKSLIQYIDSSMRLEALQLPPDTAIPKKRMTLKRLRKAQRLRDDIAGGAADTTKQREWPAFNLDSLSAALEAAEDLVEGAAPKAAAPVEAAPPPKKGAKGAPVVEAAPVSASALLPPGWADTTAAASAVNGAVTTAHRSLIAERDKSIAIYVAGLEDMLAGVREKLGLLLRQEESWGKQWENQVAMLRNGKL